MVDRLVTDDHALRTLSRFAGVLLATALLAGGTACLAAADGGAAIAKKKCAKKQAVASKKRCKRRKSPTPPVVTPPAAAPSASLSISPTSHDFGPIIVGSSSSSQTFTVTNAGPDPSGSLTSSLGGTDPSFYAISSDTCNGTSLAGGSSCTLDVNCQSVGVLEGTRNATLTVAGTPGGYPLATLTCFLTT
jgi:hypothetical protein